MTGFQSKIRGFVGDRPVSVKAGVPRFVPGRCRLHGRARAEPAPPARRRPDGVSAAPRERAAAEPAAGPELTLVPRAASVPAAEGRARARLSRRVRLPLAPVARARDARGLRRRASLLEARPEPRLGARLHASAASPCSSRRRSRSSSRRRPGSSIRLRPRTRSSRRSTSPSWPPRCFPPTASRAGSCGPRTRCSRPPPPSRARRCSTRPYLMSEALAYPVFLLALATMLRAIDRPSPRMEVAVVAVSLAAVLTRLQFVVVPLVYLIAAPLAGRLCGESLRFSVRRHALSLGVLAALVAVPLADRRRGPRHLRRRHGARLRPAHGAALDRVHRRAAAVRGRLAHRARRAARARRRSLRGHAGGPTPRSRRSPSSSVVLVLLEVGMIAAGEAGRAIERYDDLPRPPRGDRVLRLRRARSALAARSTSGSRSPAPRRPG